MTKKHYILIISGTDIIRHPGISAAGASHEMLKYTAALDAEFIYHGELKTLDKLPVSPSGIVSPALIAKACLDHLGAKITIIDAGAHVKPQCPYLSLREKPGGDISSEVMMSLEEAEELFEEAKKITIDSNDELIIAECVVGGTTTAYYTLRALGCDCQGLISSSIPSGNHNLKEELVSQALAKKKASDNPLSFAADPMQIVAAGLSIAAREKNIPVTLAGGTQMIAVKALIDRFSELDLSISPSPWVMNDKSANFSKLLELVSPTTRVGICNKPYSATLGLSVKDLSKKACDKEISLEEIISQYDEGHVKEGLGMGALIHQVQMHLDSQHMHI